MCIRDRRKIDRSKKMSDTELKIHNILWEFMPQMYAMIREVMHREFNRRHYDTQLLSGVILAQGQRLTELKTGEGKTLVATLRYSGRHSALSDVKRISKPGLRVYKGATSLPWVLNGLGLAIISTPKGIMTDKQARKAGLGGEVMAYVW